MIDDDYDDGNDNEDGVSEAYSRLEGTPLPEPLPPIVFQNQPSLPQG